jgi:hypothetical protein
LRRASTTSRWPTMSPNRLGAQRPVIEPVLFMFLAFSSLADYVQHQHLTYIL